MRSVFVSLLLITTTVWGQKLPSIEEKTTGLKKLEGFVPAYADEALGKLWLEIPFSDSELLYAMSLPAGLGSNDIGLDRGLMGGERIVKFVRNGRKVLMVQPNYQYRALTPDAAERRAVEQSFAQSTLWGFELAAESNGRLLVDATDFLLRDAMQVANKLRSAKQGNYAIDKMRSALYWPRIKVFPKNTELEATVTFVNTDGQVGRYAESVTPSTEAITLRMHHSFVQLPDAGYKPRLFDPRSSFIPLSFYDYSTPVSEPLEKKYIIRHRLQKKDPTAAVSDPVKPIVYYLDNGTPEPIRSALLDGARWWNQAFEAAGYSNAFKVEILPDSADPMDIRYNMINWVHRSTRGWSYGASVTDPRTGEIIKGQVSLGSLRVRQDYLIAQGLLAPFETGVPANDKMLQMALARLRQLAAHEVGHTLGLMHNYTSSVNGRASVMDYPHPVAELNARGEIDLANAYDEKIGEWDKVSIRWGYGDLAPGTNEQVALNGILTDADKRGLLFISDRDARDPAGAHPQAHLWDNGTTAADELKRVMNVRAKALQNFGVKSIRPGMPMAMLEDVLVPVYFFHRYQLEAATKLVGGLDYRYALRGDGQPVTQPIARAEQMKALMVVLDCLDPKLLKLPDTIVKLIPPRPAGYDFSRELFKKRTGLPFDALAPAESAADMPFSLLFQPERLNRLAQYDALGYGLSLPDMLDACINRTFERPRRTSIEKLIQEQTEQVLLTYLLAASVNEQCNYATRSLVHARLAELKAYCAAQQKATADAQSKAHYAYALKRMEKPEEAKPTLHAAVPPGAPIGCDF
jgi:hypothetical protein